MENGVHISAKEMYSLIQEANRVLQRIEARLDILESKMESANKTDERSRQAFTTAKEALELAEKLENQLFWLWRTTIGALIACAVEALFYISHSH